MAGNVLETEPNTARADAGNGLFLKGLGNGEFKPLLPGRSEFFVSDDARDMAIVETSQGRLIIIGINSGPIRIFKVNERIENNH